VSHFERKFQGKGASPPTIFGVRKLESLGYCKVKKIAENFNRLSRAHQRYRQVTDRQTDRRQNCDSIYSERNVVTIAKKQLHFRKDCVYNIFRLPEHRRQLCACVTSIPEVECKAIGGFLLLPLTIFRLPFRLILSLR